MYQLRTAICRLICLVILLSLSGISVIPAQADPSRLTTAQAHKTENLAFVSKTFELLPPRKALKKAPSEVELYEYDDTPLGDRRAFLFVHGLRGEFYPYFRWQKLAQHLSASSDFDVRYKIYFARYPTQERIDSVVPQFRQAIDRLYSSAQKRPITICALSMGGNLVYESMSHPDYRARVFLILSLGTPFHGSPLFSQDWMQYSLYKKLSWPWTRIDHSLSLRLYFNRNKNLLEDFNWDGADRAIPVAGEFRSRLPFGPKGNLTEEDTSNKRLNRVNEKTQLKKKLIAYGGYLKNPYLGPKSVRFIESTAMYPVMVVWYKFPAHLAREHSVLRLLNRDIASVLVKKEWHEKAKTQFLYALNDGITPLTSALFMPPKYLAEHACVLTDDIPSLKRNTDVKLARVFKNIDHLTFIDGFRPLGSPDELKDELDPQVKSKQIFDWVLYDIVNQTPVMQHLASDGPAGSKKH